MGKLYAIKNGELFMRSYWNSGYEEYNIEFEDLDIWNMSDILYESEEYCVEFLEDFKNWYKNKYDAVDNCFCHWIRNDINLDDINNLKVVKINVDINFEEE